MEDAINIASADVIQPKKEYQGKVVLTKILSEGREESRSPITLVFRFEGTDSNITLVSWAYELMPTFKEALRDKNVCDVQFFVKEYNNVLSCRLDYFQKTTTISTPMEVVVKDDYSQRIQDLAKMIQDEQFKSLINKLLVPEFYTWPAAMTLHHAYPGGLAEHTYGVAAEAINMANLCNGNKGMVINYDLLIAGALIHDIGKLDEYDQDGNITEKGHLMTHIIFGIERIDQACKELNIDSNQLSILKLKHIIASHHGKYEFGSPSLPVIPEAYIISEADNDNAKMEIVAETLAPLTDKDISRPMGSLDGSKVFKI